MKTLKAAEGVGMPIALLASLALIAVLIAMNPATSVVAKAQEATAETAGLSVGLKYIAAGLAVGLAGIGGGYAVGVAGAAAASAVAENREIAGTVLLYVALGEGIAIYGLLIAILIIFMG